MIKSPAAATSNSPTRVRVHAGPPGTVAPLTGFVPAKTHYPCRGRAVKTVCIVVRSVLHVRTIITLHTYSMYFVLIPSGRCCEHISLFDNVLC